MARTSFLIAVFAQLFMLAGMIGAKFLEMDAGQVIVLETEAVRPRTPYSQDELKMSYKINRLRPAMLPPGPALRKGDCVYVVLRHGQPGWEPLAVCPQLPRLDLDQAVIKGRVARSTRDRVLVEYGIEDFIAPAGLSRLADIRLWKVVVDGRGHAVIQGPVLH